MAMDRRGFIQRMLASVAAFSAAGGGRSVALAKAKGATPCIGISADTSRFEKAIGDAGAEVVRLLRECRVTSSEWVMSTGEMLRYRATFEKRDKSAPTSELDGEAWKIIETGYLTSVNVEATADIDVVHLGDFSPVRPKEMYRFHAEWIVPK